jgi:hypothetical protein
LAELEHVGMSCAANCASSLVRLWHGADIKLRPLFGRYGVESGHHPPASDYSHRSKQRLFDHPIAAERAYMLEVLAKLLAEVRARLMDEVDQAYGPNFNMVRLDLDALKHEIRKFTGAGVIELPSFLGSERQRVELQYHTRCLSQSGAWELLSNDDDSHGLL